MPADTAVMAVLPCGTVVGRELPRARVFHGIPFAEPPVGGLRWRRPVPLADWTGVLEAVDPGPAPVQRRRAGDEGVPASSEDCLRLSVWVPRAAPAPVPVVVWLYGGGFEGGYGTMPESDPAALVDVAGVLVVAPNYRVGALGFASLAHRGGPFAEATNLGLLDVVCALAWVGRNVAALGGDPTRVTVMGHSAGAFLAAALLGTPGAAGLFRQLVLLSGGASRIVPPEVAAETGDRFVAELIAATGTAASAVADAPAEAILAAQAAAISDDIGDRNGPRPRSYGVVLDGATVTSHPMAVVEAGGAAGVPLLVGTTGREVAAFLGDGEVSADSPPGRHLDELISWGVPDDRAREIVSHYGRDLRPAAGVRESVLTDWIYRLPAARLAAAQCGAGGPVWSYEIADAAAWGTAAHGVDVPLVFGTSEAPDVAGSLGYPPQHRQRRTEVTRFLHRALGAFAVAGDPGWQPHRVEGAVVVLGDSTTVRPGFRAEVVKIWEGIPRP